MHSAALPETHEHGRKDEEAPHGRGDASSGISLAKRDRLAQEIYQSVLYTARGDWIELMDCAPFCSHYHLSAYSTTKFGTQGAPYAYLPMSLQQPIMAASILGRQRAAEANAWSWTLQKEGSAPEHAPASHPSDTAARHDTPPSLTKALRDAMQLAGMDAGALFTSSDPVPTSTVKTSDSHPIQVSPILPPTQLAALSEQVYNHLPRDYAHLAPCASTDAPTCADAAGMPDRCAYLCHAERIPHGDFPAHLVQALQEPECHLMGQARGTQLIRLCATRALDKILAPSGPPGDAADVPVHDLDSDKTCLGALAPAPRQIGNMILSSCPGKKVRLDGPVRGRSTVCRDLKADLERYRAMGIKAIVCCLNDDELGALCSPGSEYVDQVAAHGFDLVRLPIAEGFAPTDLVKFDIMMTGLVLTYTLRGASILVHCRGGVGRAGLVAAAWVLKMGFAAPRPTPSAPPSTWGEIARDAQTDARCVTQTVLQLVEVVRRRRSLRAIETAEQVQFLMDYVRFIHRQEHTRLCVAQCLSSD